MKNIQIKRQFQLAAMFLLSTLSLQTMAIQPLADLHLAEAVGEKSPVRLNVNTNAKEQITDKKLQATELQLQDIRKQQQYQSLRVSMQMNEEKLQLKDDHLARKSHEIAENNFGLESISMMWNGNVQAVVDLSRLNNTTYSHATGQYELNNVQGRVTTTVKFD